MKVGTEDQMVREIKQLYNQGRQQEDSRYICRPRPLGVRMVLLVALAAMILGLPAFTLGLPAFALETHFATPAKQALILDYNSNTVLYQKQGDMPMAPASMSKLMTVAIVFDALDRGDITLDSEFDVSEKAWRTKGSKMFVLVDTKISVRNLLRGIIIQSGNDACIVVAENIAGSEEAFVERMNKKAAEWGLTQSRFTNPAGLPHPDHRMSPYDLASLTRKIIHDYPDYFSFFQERDFTWSDITQQNRNPVLGNFDGADGMKTGYTEQSGYGVVATALSNDARRIIVLNGLDSNVARRREALLMLERAFSEFDNRVFFTSGDDVGSARVYNGQDASVALKVKSTLAFSRHKKTLAGARAHIVYTGPLKAPIAREKQVAILRFSLPGEPFREYPLYAAENVPSIGVLDKIKVGLKTLLTPPGTTQSPDAQ